MWTSLYFASFSYSQVCSCATLCIDIGKVLVGTRIRLWHHAVPTLGGVHPCEKGMSRMRHIASKVVTLLQKSVPALPCCT